LPADYRKFIVNPENTQAYTHILHPYAVVPRVSIHQQHALPGIKLLTIHQALATLCRSNGELDPINRLADFKIDYLARGGVARCRAKP
jgi:hypothetical protein